MDSNLFRGDYVLATKYTDGSFGDHWVIGFYDCNEGGRYYVVDSDGQHLRRNGFRRCEKISKDEGAILLGSDFDDLTSGRIWEWLYLKRIDRLRAELAEAKRGNLRQLVKNIRVATGYTKQTAYVIDEILNLGCSLKNHQNQLTVVMNDDDIYNWLIEHGAEG